MDRIPVYLNRGKIAAERVGDVLVGATAIDGVSSEELVPYIKAVAATVAAQGPLKALVTVALSVGPSAHQRGLIRDAEPSILFKKVDCVALVTQSAMVRGALTAIGWVFGGRQQIKAFAPSNAYEIADWLARYGDAALLREALRDTSAAAGYAPSMIRADNGLPKTKSG